MSLRRLAPLLSSWLVLGLLGPVACSGEPQGGPDENDVGDSEDSSEAGDSGVELESWQASEGTVNVVGASPAVPVSNRSFSGFRDDPTTYVRCTHDRDALDADRPKLEIVAGFADRSEPQVTVEIFDVFAREPFQQSYEASAGEAELPELNVETSLSHDLVDGAYVYSFGVDPYGDPPATSSCQLDVDTFDEERLAGTLTCSKLVPRSDSPDRPITNAAGPTADVTLAFDCPLFVIGEEPGGGSGGSPGSGGSTGSGGSGGLPGSGGGGGLEESCRGSATSCSILSTFSCSTALGCSLQGDCTGSASSCYYLFNSYSCNAQDGCYWSNSDCKGYASSCSSQLGEYSCIDQEGCNWNEDCEGIPLSCSTFSTASSCGQQPGCYWL